jgi:hypothetical protein
MKCFFILLLLLFSLSCRDHAKLISTKNSLEAPPVKNFITDINDYKQVKNIPLPHGFSLIKNDRTSFAFWLENIALKKDKTVHLYDGSQKQNQSAQFAVLDITVGNKNLQQCADAVMRLRAEYLFNQQKFDDIFFVDNNGGKYPFKVPHNRQHFVVYLDQVFGMCGTASLSKQLNTIKDFVDIKAGDVLIKGGFPGHAVIVIAVAQNNDGKKIYLIAQSYMPAQDIHVLINPMNKNISPWYEINEEDEIYTPEYLFHKNELKEW